MISILFVSLAAMFLILAAACNACMDTLQFHYYTSVFNRSGQKDWMQWWNPEVSWKNKYIDGDPRHGKKKTIIFFTDAWHMFKSLMVVFLALSSYFMWQSDFHITRMPFVDFGLYLIAYGIIWNTVFNLFYNHLLLKK